MNERAQKMGIGTAALAFALAVVAGGSQTTGGQMQPVQSLANQAKGGQPSMAPGSAAPRVPSPASTARPNAASVAATPKSQTTTVAQAAPAARAMPPAAGTQAASPAAAAPATSGARRDPFRPLVIKGKGDDIPTRLPPGKGGLVIGQLTVQGIVRSLDGKWIAVVDNKTKRAYFLYAGDELYNGTVSRITENSVVFAERVNDPTGRQQSREVVKQMLR